MSTLFKINEEQLSIINELELNGGELTEDLEARLTINKNDLQSKSIAYREVIESKESFLSRVDEEIKRLQAIKKRELNTIDRLKSMLLFGS